MGNVGASPSAPEPPTKERVTFSYSTYRRRLKKLQRDAAYRYALLLKFDASRTGTLSREEVKAMATELLRSTPTDEEIDMIMKVGGPNCLREIALEELPKALAIVDQVRSHRAQLVDCVEKCQEKNPGRLAPGQLAALLTELNDGVPPEASDLAYVFEQLGISREAAGDARVDADTLQAAIANWYCLCECAGD